MYVFPKTNTITTGVESQGESNKHRYLIFVIRRFEDERTCVCNRVPI